MTDCEALRRLCPDLPKCCAYCHERNDLASARVDDHFVRICCKVLGGLFSRPVMDFEETEGPRSLRPAHLLALED